MHFNISIINLKASDLFIQKHHSLIPAILNGELGSAVAKIR
jgi:hypothetical protein